jgi:hypothetical protein
MLTYPAWRSIAFELRKLCVPTLLLVCLWARGCGGGSATPAPAQPATILTQPMNDTVMVGQTGQFSVTASGTAPLTYQWNKNGSPLQGATSSTYATPATVENDSGSVFTVTVSNSLDSVTSDAAGLLVLTQPGPAPKAGDLRFRQIDAPATINGYQGARQLLVSNGPVLLVPGRIRDAAFNRSFVRWSERRPGKLLLGLRVVLPTSGSVRIVHCVPNRLLRQL